MNINKKTILNFCLIILFCSFFSLESFGQFTMAPFPIKSSNFYGKLNEYKATNPKASTNEIATKANELLNEDGLNFVFTFNAETCEKIKAFKEDKKNQGKPLTLRATLQSTDSEKTNVVLPDVKFDKSECGNCFVEIPLLEVTKDSFITKIRGENIKFDLPQNFNLNSVVIFENQALQKVSNQWIIPSRLSPISISPDSGIIYFDLPNKEFEDITLAIFQSGVFQFFVKKDLDLSLKANPLKSQSSTISYLSFGEDSNKKILGFNKPCQ